MKNTVVVGESDVTALAEMIVRAARSMPQHQFDFADAKPLIRFWLSELPAPEYAAAQNTWTEARVRSNLAGYAELHERVNEVACIVYKVRWPQSYSPSFEIDLDDIGEEAAIVSVRWYTRGDYEALGFPIEYLWNTDAAEIRSLETAADAARKIAAEEKKLQDAEKNRLAVETKERAIYDRLKAKFEGGLVG